MDRPKRPPPVPKFKDDNDNAKLEQQLSSFMNSINQVTNDSQSVKKEEVKSEVGVVRVEEGKCDKKKLTLASINSKLNNMLNAKKINISSAISAEVEKEKNEKQENQIRKIQIQYDPQQPNNYQLTKNNYLPQLNTLNHSDSEDEDTQIIQVQQVQQPNNDMTMVAEEYQPEQKQQIALRMMQKFGYKVGEGLGKQSQGIKTPLIVRKTTDSSGIIEQSNISLNFLISPEISAKNALTAHGIQVSEVIVFVGLLNLQELEEGLQEQIKQECCLYGVIKEWMLYLLDQLRIFVEFQTKEQALNAFVKLNGKYFGEKLVSLRFYDVQHFHNKQFNDQLHAHIPT